VPVTGLGYCERCGKALQPPTKSSFGGGELPNFFEVGYFTVCKDCYTEIESKMDLESHCYRCGQRKALRNRHGGWGNKEPECVNPDCPMFCGEP
jgi:hypothetical protein